MLAPPTGERKANYREIVTPAREVRIHAADANALNPKTNHVARTLHSSTRLACCTLYRTRAAIRTRARHPAKIWRSNFSRTKSRNSIRARAMILAIDRPPKFTRA